MGLHRIWSFCQPGIENIDLAILIHFIQLVRPKRGAMNDSGLEREINVVGYWFGELPRNSILHFLSFLKFNPNLEYHLSIENGPEFKPDWLAEIDKNNQIVILSLDLDSLLESLQIPAVRVSESSEFLRKALALFF